MPRSSYSLRYLALILFAAMFLPTGANAWSSRGHKYVADVAESLLTETTRVAVQKLLHAQGRKRLSDVATWADQVRALKIPGQPSHAIRIPWDDTYVANRDCPRRDCALGTLQISAEILSDTTVNDAARAMALNYVVHLIGDIHQPLHVSTNRAFSAVEFGGKRYSLHRLWDRDIANVAVTRPTCDGKHSTETVYSPADLLRWVKEVHLIAHDVYTKLDGYPTIDGVPDLPADYVLANSEIACNLLNTAGGRLASVLNYALDPHGTLAKIRSSD